MELKPEQLQQVLDYLDKIATKLGVGVEHIWPWFIRQQYVDAIVSAVALIFFSTIAFTLLAITLKYWRKEYRYDDDNKIIKEYSIYHANHEGFWVVGNIIAGIVMLATFVLFGLEFFDIFNPEYHAFKDILSSVH